MGSEGVARDDRDGDAFACIDKGMDEEDCNGECDRRKAASGLRVG